MKQNLPISNTKGQCLAPNKKLLGMQQSNKNNVHNQEKMNQHKQSPK